MWILAAQMLMGCGAPSTKVATAIAESGTFEVTLAVAGTLQPEKEIVINAPTTQASLRISFLVPQGSFVEKGDKLIEFEKEEILKTLQTTGEELDLARTKLLKSDASARLSITNANAEITGTELSLRLATMQRTDSETVPLVERERARIAELHAQLDIETAKAKLSALHLEVRSEHNRLQLNITKKNDEVEQLQKDLDQTIILAPTDGLVLLKKKWDGSFWRVGSEPWDDTKLLSLPNLNKMKIVCKAHEADSLQVQLDQRAIVTLEAFPDRSTDAFVTSVADLAIAEGDGNSKYLNFDVALERTGPEMKPGLSARVELIIGTYPNSVWIPIEAVQHNEHPSVWVAGLTGWTQTPIELGPENDTHVVVTGLSAGTEVALSDPYQKDPVKAASL